MLSITILIDNYIKVQDMVAEHGLSFLIDNGDKKILFDTGQSGHFLENAKKMELDMESVDSVIISHGHYDHTGGLLDLLRLKGKNTDIFAHPDIFKKKYVKIKRTSRDADYRYIGIPFEREELEDKKAVFHLSSSKVEVAEKMFLIGEVGNKGNDSNVFFQKEGDDFLVDRLLDDNSMVIETKGPSVLLLGCAHSGILNILNKIEKEYDISRGLLIIGGLHLIGMNRDEIEEIAESLSKYEIKKMIPCHCTGIRGYEVLKERFKDKCDMGEVSKTFIIKDDG